MKKRILNEEQLNECKQLKAIFRARAKSAGVTQQNIADELGISQAAVSHYLNGVNPLNPRVAAVFSKFLRMPVQSFSPRLADEIKSTTEAARIGLFGLDEDVNVKQIPQPAMSYRYPIISWVSAGSWEEAVQPYPDGFSDRYEISDYNSKGPAFWLEVKGDSMTSPNGTSVPEGMMILVDTEADVQPGKLVIAKLPASNEATFKKLVEDGGIRYLKPLNPAYKMVECDEHCRIIGVAVRMTGKL